MRIPPLGAVWFVPEEMPELSERTVRDRRREDKPPSGTIVIPPGELQKALAREQDRETDREQEGPPAPSA
jgi:hypothetical protein